MIAAIADEGFILGDGDGVSGDVEIVGDGLFIVAVEKFACGDGTPVTTLTP